MRKQMLSLFMACSLVVVTAFSVSTTVYAEENIDYASFYYVNDPMTNLNAAKDILLDANALYGYSPNPDSKRLGTYADYDWSDPAVVEKAKSDRIAYHNEMHSMYILLDEMKASGKSTEEIARAVNAERNRIRLDSFKDDPEGLAKTMKSNLDTYGNEYGPTADSLFEKYGDWETVITKAFSANLGMDACLGLYDTYYDEYVSLGLVEPACDPTLSIIRNANSPKAILSKENVDNVMLFEKDSEGNYNEIYYDDTCVIYVQNGEAVLYSDKEECYFIDEIEGEPVYGVGLFGYDDGAYRFYQERLDEVLASFVFYPWEKVESASLVDGMLNITTTISPDMYRKYATEDTVKEQFDGVSKYTTQLLVDASEFELREIDYFDHMKNGEVEKTDVISAVYNTEKPDVSRLYAITHGYDRMVSITNLDSGKKYSVSTPNGVATRIYLPTDDNYKSYNDPACTEAFTSQSDYSKSVEIYIRKEN